MNDIKLYGPDNFVARPSKYQVNNQNQSEKIPVYHQNQSSK